LIETCPGSVPTEACHPGHGGSRRATDQRSRVPRRARCYAVPEWGAGRPRLTLGGGPIGSQVACPSATRGVGVSRSSVSVDRLAPHPRCAPGRCPAGVGNPGRRRSRHAARKR
jgi:hypothetical protein